ncbi:MAG: hypothetical protein RL215_1880 [Planctomycetota bacterium]|jgi:hypothetical protein
MPESERENAEGQGGKLESDDYSRKPVREGFSDERQVFKLDNTPHLLKIPMTPIYPEIVGLVSEVQFVRVVPVMTNSKFGRKIGFPGLYL